MVEGERLIGANECWRPVVEDGVAICGGKRRVGNSCNIRCPCIKRGYNIYYSCIPAASLVHKLVTTRNGWKVCGSYIGCSLIANIDWRNKAGTEDTWRHCIRKSKRNIQCVYQVVIDIKDSYSSRVIERRNTIETVAVNRQADFIIIISQVPVIHFSAYNMRCTGREYLQLKCQVTYPDNPLHVSSLHHQA